jgi:hypothetical protein
MRVNNCKHYLTPSQSINPSPSTINQKHQVTKPNFQFTSSSNGIQNDQFSAIIDEGPKAGGWMLVLSLGN